MVAWSQGLLSSKLEISVAHSKIWFSFKYSSEADFARLFSTLPAGNNFWLKLFSYRRVKKSLGKAFGSISSSLPIVGFFS